MPETAWREGVIARYLTVAGATVDITTKPEFNPEARYCHCNGCGEDRTWDRYCGDLHNLRDARCWAQAHAETCRALPKPNA